MFIKSVSEKALECAIKAIATKKNTIVISKIGIATRKD